MLDINQVHKIYRNWQTNSHEIGTAILIEKVKDGIPFILDDYVINDENVAVKIKEKEQEVFCYARWVVMFIELTEYGKQTVNIGETKSVNIRYLERIGIKSAMLISPPTQNTLVDKFLKVDGVEVF
jgi:hypothetical protein